MLLIQLTLGTKGSTGAEPTPQSVEIRFLNPEASLPTLVKDFRTTLRSPRIALVLAPSNLLDRHISPGFAAILARMYSAEYGALRAPVRPTSYESGFK